MKEITIFTDGSATNNGDLKGVGGWGAVLIYSTPKRNKEDMGHSEDDKTLEIYGSQDNTTNQQMEIKAVIVSLKRIKDTSIPVTIYSDSAYLINCMNDRWFKKWERNGWKNSKKQPVANKELWLELIKTINENMFVKINWKKVKAHVGHHYNEIADNLAKKGMYETIDKRKNCWQELK